MTGCSRRPDAGRVGFDVLGLVSGVLLDGRSLADSELVAPGADPLVTGRQNTSGRYSISFETSGTAFHGNAGIVGAIFYTGGGEYEDYVQAVPGGTTDIVQNLRLRRILTVNAGEYIVMSIDPDSSLAYDGEDVLSMDWVREQFHVRVANAGTLTIAASGGYVDARAFVPQLGGALSLRRQQLSL